MFKDHPKIEVVPSTFDRKIIKVGWFVLLAQCCFLFIFYFDLPSKIPTHFSFDVTVNGYGRKNTLWFLLFISTITYYLITRLITRLKPWKFNYPVKITTKNASEIYSYNIEMLALINLFIAILLTIISFEIILKAKEFTEFHLSFTFIPICLFIIILPFFYSYKMFKIPQ